MVPEEIEFVVENEKPISPQKIQSPVGTAPPPIEEPAKAQSHECFSITLAMNN